MSFANQFMGMVKLAEEGKGYDNKVYDIDEEQDQEIAGIKLATSGTGLDELTEEQIRYRDDYTAGT